MSKYIETPTSPEKQTVKSRATPIIIARVQPQNQNPEPIMAAKAQRVATRVRPMLSPYSIRPTNPTPQDSACSSESLSRRPKQCVHNSIHDIEKCLPEDYKALMSNMLVFEKQIDIIILRHLSRVRSERTAKVPTPIKVMLIISHKRSSDINFPSHLEVNVMLQAHEGGIALPLASYLNRLEVRFLSTETIAPASWDLTTGLIPNCRGFTIPRCIKRPCTVIIDVYFNCDILVLLPAFARLMRIPYGTYDQIETAFFMYVKQHNLINIDDHGINCDIYLTDVFKKSFILIDKLKEELYTQVMPNAPFQCAYFITEGVYAMQSFEVIFPSTAVADVLQDNLITNVTNSPLMQKVDEELSQIAKNIQSCDNAVKFYNRIAENPYSTFLESQNQMDETTSDSGDQTIPKLCLSSFFADNCGMTEAVAHYLNNSAKQKDVETSENLNT